MVKINSKKLKDFFKAASLNKLADELVLNITASGFEIESKDPGITIGVKTLLKKEEIKSFELLEEGSVFGIRNISNIISYLEGFKGEVEVEFKENKLIIFNEKRNAFFATMNPEFISEYSFPGIGAKLLKFDPGVIFEKEILNNIIKNYNLMGEDIEFIFNEKTAEIKTNSTTDSISEKLAIGYKNISTSVGKSFKIAVDILNGFGEGKITLSILETEMGNPLKFNLITEGIICMIMVAPIGNNEEVKEEVKETEPEKEDTIDDIL